VREPEENYSVLTKAFEDDHPEFRRHNPGVLKLVLCHRQTSLRYVEERGDSRHSITAGTVFRYFFRTHTSEQRGASMKYSSLAVDIPRAKKLVAIERLGFAFLRYGLVIAIGWIAAMKATEYEAKGIQPLIAHSPLLSWGYAIWTIHHFTMIIGATELIIAWLLAVRPWLPKASAVGSVGAVFMFLTTLSFIITTPGWEPSLGGFPALSGDVGEFLIKDFVLLGAALWTLADSLSAVSPLPRFLRDRG
jgi:reactive chlorine resistance protein C